MRKSVLAALLALASFGAGGLRAQNAGKVADGLRGQNAEGIADGLRVQSAGEVADERILSFESSVRPFEALRGSRIELSGAHYKHGAKSLRWEWSREGAQLRIAAPVGYLAENPDPKERSVSTFVFWVYAARPQEGHLRFEFLKEGRVCAQFDYALGFTGWRGAWAAFDRDMQGAPEEGMDQMCVTAVGAREGELFFDHLILSSFQDSRHHTADFQAPFINAATSNHWLVLLRSWRNPLPGRTEPLTDGERRDMRTVGERFRGLLLEGQKPASLRSLKKRFDEYAIEELPDGTLRGKPVWFTRYAETYIGLGHRNVAALYARNGQLLRKCNDLLFRLAVAWEASRDADERRELERMYVLLTRHLLDQGFAAGSAQGTLHHLGYSMRNFYTAPVVMREVLLEAGLLEEVQRAMEWFSGVGEVKVPAAAPGMDIDAFNTSLFGRLASIVLLPETAEKAVWFDCFARWVDNGYALVEGTAPCFKSDGTVFHHRRHYPAYAVGGFDGAVDALWLLSGTRYAVSPESHAHLKKALSEMRFYCNLRSFPLALSGRHPDGRGALVPRHYARMALAGSPGGADSLDREMAAAYLRLAPGEDRFTRQFAAAGIEAEPSPEGFRVYPYNASASYRCGGWLLTVAGHSRYLWSAEIYSSANLYGRYLTHGSLQLLGGGEPVDAFGSGFRQEGWDWCHIPGTTAVERPMEEMRADVRNVDTLSGYEEMLLSDESFAGGVSHRGRCGAFAMKLHENDKYNGSLRARKSWFFFDGHVVCLGSDIENALPGGVHTTLFQNALDDAAQPVEVNGEPVAEFPWRTTLDGGGTLRDNLGNLWVVPRGRVTVRKVRQHSLHEETGAPTESDFAAAWIDHGSGAVRGGSYEYMLVPGAADGEPAASAELPYEVLRCDRAAHVLRDVPSETYCYVFFEAGATDEGVLAAASHPVLAICSEEAGVLTVSLCDPDLRFYEGPADELCGPDGRRIERSIYARAWKDNPSIASEVCLTLRGCWQPDGEAAGCRVEEAGERTLLYVVCREGATREINLKRR